MSEEKHQRSRSGSPHEKSRLATLLALQDMAAKQEQPQPPLWSGPVDCTGMPPKEQAHWNWWKPTLIRADQYLREEVAADLAPILSPGLRGNPDHPSVKAIFEELLEARRLVYNASTTVLFAFDNMGGLDRFKPVWAIIFYTRSAFSITHPEASANAINEMVGEYLSFGIPRGEAEGYGSTRDHVRRASAAYLEWLRRTVNAITGARDGQRKLVDTVFWAWSDHMAMLREVDRQARANPRYKGLRGTALAEAIDEYPGVLTVLQRLRDRRTNAA